MPRYPVRPISSHRSVVFSPARAFSVNHSRPYFPASLATSRRSACRSSDSVKRRSFLLLRPRPGPRRRPPGRRAGRTARSTVPAWGAATVCCIFIASSTSTGCAGVDRVALLHRDADDRAGHRREQAATGHGVGRVGEPRDDGQRDVAGRGVDVDPVAGDRDVVRRGDAVALERHAGRARRADDEPVDDVPVAPAVPLDLIGSSARSLGTWADDPVKRDLGWLTTLRQATGMPCWTARAQPVALGQRQGRGDGVVAGRRVQRRRVVVEERRADVTGQERGSRSTPTSWSRLVVTPWIRAPAQGAASVRAACSRVGAHATTLASIAS